MLPTVVNQPSSNSVRKTTTIICKLEVETSPNRSSSSYSGATHGYPPYNGDRVSKSPSPSAHYRPTSKRESGNHTKSRRDDGLHIPVTTRSRSPPVVTIAPTLSLSSLHYQDSRKVCTSTFFWLI
jgi:hypothetical protein